MQQPQKAAKVVSMTRLIAAKRVRVNHDDGTALIGPAAAAQSRLRYLS
jgi:hypothetical protein